MNYDEIKRRIKQRRYASIIECNGQNNSHKGKKKNSFLSFCTSVMTILVLALGVLIYAKKDEKGVFIQENFGIRINFVSFNTKVSKVLDSILDYDIFNNNNASLKVDVESMYISVGNNKYSTSTNTAKVISDGTVIYAKLEGEKYLVVIQHDLGFTSTYYGIDECFVKLYDRMKFEDTIGQYYDDSIEIVFTMDNQVCSYEEIVSYIREN